MIEIGPHQDVPVAEPAEVTGLLHRVPVGKGAPGLRHTVVQERPPFPGVLVFVGRLVMERDQGVIVEAQHRPQNDDGAERQRDALGPEDGHESRRGAALPAGQEREDRDGDRRGREQEEADRAADAGPGDGVLVRREVSRGNRTEGPSRRLPGEHQVRVPLQRETVVERQRVPAGGEGALGDGVRLGLDRSSVNRQVGVPVNVEREPVGPGARRPEQPAPVDVIRRHGVPREVPQPALVPMKDVSRVEPLGNGEIDLRVDPLVDWRLEASLPRDQVPALESPGRLEQGEEEKDEQSRQRREREGRGPPG